MTTKKSTKLLSILLAILMIFSTMPMTMSFAAISYSGTCGDNLTWKVDKKTLVLEISGTGPMENYTSRAPWYDAGSYIKSIKINEGVTTIGDRAFTLSFTNDIDVTVPDTVTSIGESAFANSRISSINIPDSVTSIGSSAFSFASRISSIHLPDSVTELGDFAFYYCQSLNDIVLSKNITTIPDWTFTGILALENVVIPDGVTSIGDFAFADCSNLKSVVIPASVTEISDSAFTAYSYGEDFTLIGAAGSFAEEYAAGNGLAFKAISGTCGVDAMWKFDPETGKLVISGAGAMNDYDYDEEKPWEEFKNLITEVVVEDGITATGTYAFAGLPALKKATIPESVTFIGVDAFQYCTALEEAYIYADVEILNGGLFDGATSLKTVVVPEGLKRVGSRAFANTVIESADFLETVEVIGSWAFAGCKNLKEVSVPNCKEFYWCSFQGSGLEKIVIADCATVKYGAFSYCNNLKEVVIGDCAILDSFCFEKSAIETVTLGSDITYTNLDTGYTGSYDFSQFYGCENIKRVIYSSEHTDSPLFFNLLFSDNAGSLKEMVIYTNNMFDEEDILPELAESVDVVYAYRNSYAWDLFSSYGIKVMDIAFFDAPEYPFDYELVDDTVKITSIKGDLDGELVIPSEICGYPVTTIGYRAFVSSDITSLVIPETIRQIEDEAFYGCESLEEIEFASNEITIGADAFANNISLKKLEFEEDSTILIDEGAFAMDVSLKEVKIPDGCRYIIGDEAFVYCFVLEDLYLGSNGYYDMIEELTAMGIDVENAKIIGNAAFADCNSLTDVYIGENILANNIGEDVFVTEFDIFDKELIAIGAASLARLSAGAPQEGDMEIVAQIETTAVDGVIANENILITTDSASVRTYAADNSLKFTCKTHTQKSAVAENVVPSDCETAGSYDEVVYCAGCDVELSRETLTIAPLGHTAVNLDAVPATCTETGLTAGVMCADCGKILVAQETADIKAHTPGAAVVENIVDSTCAKEGTYDDVVYCTDCGFEISRTQKTIEKKDHKEAIDEAVAATCTETGLTAGKHCSKCGEILVAQETIEALGHTESEAVVENRVEPSCTKKGSYENVVYCSVCGDEISREKVCIPAKQHNYDKVITEATCEAKGYTTYTCKDCGYTFDADFVAAKGHTEVIIPAVEATCTKTGFTEGKRCSDCKKILVEQKVVAVKPHSYTAVVTNPTCTEKGYTTYTCDCGESYVADFVAARGHKTTSVYVAPTCEANGVSIVKCVNCSYTEREEIPAFGHKDDDGDNECDRCMEYLGSMGRMGDAEESRNCDCMCHESGIFAKIIYFFSKLIWQIKGTNRTCSCGHNHY